MSLNMILRNVRGIPILDLSGSLDIGPSLAALNDRVTAVLTDSKPCRFVLNVRELLTMDSAGLGELMLLFSQAAQQDCELVIVGANSSILQALRVTRMDGVLKLAEDEDAAIARA